MATVTYNLRDIVGATMTDRKGVVAFTLNNPNVVVGTGGLRPDMSYKSTPASDGTGSVNLEPTVNMFADAWYTVSILWLQQELVDSSRGAALESFLGLQVRVPAGGGRLDQLLSPPGGGSGPGPNNRVVWVSQTAPPNPRPWMLWLEQEPGDNPDPFDPRNTSNLKEWRP